MNGYLVKILFYYIYYFCSNECKKHICTWCLDYFINERTIHDHMSRCPNEVKIGNMVDELRITGGYWIEQRRRHLQRILRHSIKPQKELD